MAWVEPAAIVSQSLEPRLPASWSIMEPCLKQALLGVAGHWPHSHLLTVLPVTLKPTRVKTKRSEGDIKWVNEPRSLELR